jgi:hypothetical protein
MSMKTLVENYLEAELSNQPLAVKGVILICSLLTSPLVAGMIYASNLYRTNQSQKIVGKLVLIAISEFFLQMPFMGFEWSFPDPLLNLFLKGVTGIFIISWLWDRHFPKESLQVFEMKWLAIMILFYYTFGYLWGLLLENDVGSSFFILKCINFCMFYYGRCHAIFLVMLVIFLYRLVKRVIKK